MLARPSAAVVVFDAPNKHFRLEVLQRSDLLPPDSKLSRLPSLPEPKSIAGSVPCGTGKGVEGSFRLRTHT